MQSDSKKLESGTKGFWFSPAINAMESEPRRRNYFWPRISQNHFIRNAAVHQPQRAF